MRGRARTRRRGPPPSCDGNRLASLARLIDGGLLTVEIEQTFPFEGAPAAIQRVQEKHVRGKLVLRIE